MTHTAVTSRPAGMQPGRSDRVGAPVRAAFDRAERMAAALAARWPGGGLALAGALGSARNSLSRRWPPPAALAELFGLDARAAARLARRIAAQEARNRAVAAVRGSGRAAALRSRVRWLRPPASVPAPALLVTFHLGALPALALGLDDLPVPWTATICGDVEAEALGAPGAEALQRRTALLARRLAHLREGGFVVLAADGELGDAVPIRCLGRTLPLRRGTFFLARESGAAVLPLVALWRRSRVELSCGTEDLRAGGLREEQLAGAIGDWLAGFLREHPEALTVGLQRRLCSET